MSRGEGIALGGGKILWGIGEKVTKKYPTKGPVLTPFKGTQGVGKQNYSLGGKVLQTKPASGGRKRLPWTR